MVNKTNNPNGRPKKYLVTIFMNDVVHSFDTIDLAQSLSDMQPEKIKGKVIFRVENGDKIKERQLFVNRAKRVFYNPLAAKIFARDMERSLL